MSKVRSVGIASLETAGETVFPHGSLRMIRKDGKLVIKPIPEEVAPLVANYIKEVGLMENGVANLKGHITKMKGLLEEAITGGQSDAFMTQLKKQIRDVEAELVLAEENLSYAQQFVGQLMGQMEGPVQLPSVLPPLSSQGRESEDMFSVGGDGPGAAGSVSLDNLGIGSLIVEPALNWYVENDKEALAGEIRRAKYGGELDSDAVYYDMQKADERNTEAYGPQVPGSPGVTIPDQKSPDELVREDLKGKISREISEAHKGRNRAKLLADTWDKLEQGASASLPRDHTPMVSEPFQEGGEVCESVDPSLSDPRVASASQSTTSGPAVKMG
ncbi:MAG: hypothetical protein R3F23_06530 [Verrucomicrobiia bacterium]